MRTKQLISTLLVFFLVQTISYGQGFVFRVLASKGENKVKKADGGETIPLKTGATLMSGDELIASNGAYIGLMHKTGRTIEVRNSGITKITDLESKLASSQANVANKYAQFVMNKMNEDDGNVNDNYRSNMKATGAVSRAAGEGGAIKVYLPSSVDLLNSEATVRWGKSEGKDVSYIVSIKNIFDEEIYSTETANNSLNINFEDESLADERLVILNVKIKGTDEMSGDYGIKRMSTEDAASIATNLEALKAEIPMDDSPLNSLIYASFYEENNLVLDAITQYEKAIKLSPDVTDFQELYDNFLYKQNLKN